ncbi:MAG: class I SAM-dependent methyltransferase [Burkholderiales bacterium]|nr:class I SAM-dependent methyltransferase [Burkholderiales bacterium]
MGGFTAAAFLTLAAATLTLAAAALAQSPALPQEPQFGESGKDVPWVPMPEGQVEKILTLAGVTPADVVMDLGSGDGRVVIAAAKRGARAIGVEYNPRLVAYSRREAGIASVAERVSIEQGDLFDADLSRASVITLFLLESVNIRLQPKLLALRPGTRIVANTFQIGAWTPDVFQQDLAGCDVWCTLYLWIVPARVAGAWKTPQGTLSLGQSYQVVRGALGEGAFAMPVAGKLAGEEIRFSAGSAQYRGRVSGDTIEGTVTTSGSIRPWRATR